MKKYKQFYHGAPKPRKTAYRHNLKMPSSQVQIIDPRTGQFLLQESSSRETSPDLLRSEDSHNTSIELLQEEPISPGETSGDQGSDSSVQVTPEVTDDSASHTSEEDEVRSVGEEDDVFLMDEDIPEVPFDNGYAEDFERLGHLRNSLCGCTETTVGEAIVMVLSLGMRHSISWLGMVDILKMINVLFGRTAVPETKYLFLKDLDPYHNYRVIHHNYCQNCQLYLGQRGEGCAVRCPCQDGPKVGYFLSLGLRKQIEDLLQERNIVTGLQYGFESRKVNNDRMSDLYDGAVYKKLSAPGGPLHNNYNLSYTFNTDGISLGKTSKRSMWPIYAVINELPPKLRFKNKLLAGVWVSDHDPNMSVFLEPFVQEARDLAENGISWQFMGQIVNSKVIPVCAVVDSPARNKILNFKGLHGISSCTFCYHKGDRVRGIIVYRFSCLDDAPSLRTHEGIKRDMKKAYDKTVQNRSKKEMFVHGIKGPSPLMFLPHFDLGNMIVTDIMHLFGLVETMMLRFMNSKFPGPYHLDEEKVASVSSRLTSIAAPKSITRTPRTLTQLKLFTCAELRSWLLMYSIVCMKGKLSNKYLAHFSLFSSAIRILSQRSVSEADVSKASDLLINFVLLYEQYYGLRYMTYNVHLLTHVCKSVLNYGPLWTHSCFPFETENRYLLKFKQSPHALAEQITRKHLCKNNIIKFTDKFGVSQNVEDFTDSLGCKKHKHFSRADGCVLLGNGREVLLSLEEQEALVEFGLHENQIVSYQRVIHGHVRLTTVSYSESLKINDSRIILQDGTTGEIISIYRIETEDGSIVVLFLQTFVLDSVPILRYENIKYTDVKRISGNGPVRLIFTREISGQCVLMHFGGERFITAVPFGCYGD